MRLVCAQQLAGDLPEKGSLVGYSFGEGFAYRLNQHALKIQITQQLLETERSWPSPVDHRDGRSPPSWGAGWQRQGPATSQQGTLWPPLSGLDPGARRATFQIGR